MAISWIVALFFLVVSIVFLVLWLRVRSELAESSGASYSARSAADVFEPEQNYALLACGTVSAAGSASSYGVVRGPSDEVFPFLIEDDTKHLKAGDSFLLRNGQMYKLRQTAATDAGSESAATSAVESPATEAGIAEQPVDDDDGMTVMVSAAQTEALWKSQLEDSLPGLEIIEGVDTGCRFVVPFDVTTIGRSESNGVALREEGSSRVHCEIEYIRPNFVVRDLQSTNGTLHNGEPVDEAVLSFGDTITISDTVLLFGCKGFELAEEDSEAAIIAFEHCLDAEPDFLPAVKNLAFLLERDIRRKKEAQPLWDRVAKLEKMAGG